MTPSEIASLVRERFPDDFIAQEDFRGQVSILIKKQNSKNILKYLYEDDSLNFDYLVDICGVDYLNIKKPRFEVVYHLYSMAHKHFIRIKVQVPDKENDQDKEPFLDSVTDIWKGANWHERECYDMFGIVFEGHPDLRRILMPEDWIGYPLRKDYPLKSDLGKDEWQGYKELIEFSKKAMRYEVR
ncbi:MAG: NADH-quinone oxidoreductase subunit C [Thermodesulfovibrionales bacterium]|nr:NADH-quinone oxidoreductase subunit C [Thermodesulfovibrionales bacterium]